MEEKLWQALRQYGLLEGAETLIVALSGGADSVALFHFFTLHAESLGIKLMAAHFEHGIRGDESQQDADYVKQLCDSYQIPLHVEHARIAETRLPKGHGVESWARKLRYDYFQRLAAEHSALIATAHTLSDNAETVLFNAIRGSGTKGLAGIPPKRGAVIRPLLLATRGEVESYCQKHKLKWAQDSTNNDVEYSRNRIRMQAMPALELAHPGAARALARMAQDMRCLDDWLQTQAEELLFAARLAATVPEKPTPLPPIGADALEAEGWNAREGAVSPHLYAEYDAETLLNAPQPLLLKALGLLAGPSIDRRGLDRALEVLCGRCRAAQLPGGLVARRLKGRFSIAGPETAAAMGEKTATYEVPLAEGPLELPGGYHLDIAVVEQAVVDGERKKTGGRGLTFWAEYDKIFQCGVFRTRKPKDTFSPKGRGVTKTLKKWMNENGVDPAQRGALPLLAAGSRILWIWGAGFAGGLCCGEEPKSYLQITIELNENSGAVEG